MEGKILTKIEIECKIEDNTSNFNVLSYLKYKYFITPTKIDNV